MKARTEAHLRFAHALVRAADRIEVFTIGTRLTRVTRALQLKNREQALATASGLVSDWDGGTRIGDALQAFLAVPRFAGAARGAVVLILSDGLERGDPKAMTDAVKRLAARAWHLSWMTPLAADPGYRPETAALKSILPHHRRAGRRQLDRTPLPSCPRPRTSRGRHDARKSKRQRSAREGRPCPSKSRSSTTATSSWKAASSCSGAAAAARGGCRRWVS